MRGIVGIDPRYRVGCQRIDYAVSQHWYAIVPGVTETGGFNPYFIRNIGVAYLVCGALTWSALDLSLHALVHLWTPPPAASTPISCSSTSPRYSCRRLWHFGSRWRRLRTNSKTGEVR